MSTADEIRAQVAVAATRAAAERAQQTADTKQRLEDSPIGRVYAAFGLTGYVNAAIDAMNALQKAFSEDPNSDAYQTQAVNLIGAHLSAGWVPPAFIYDLFGTARGYVAVLQRSLNQLNGAGTDGTDTPHPFNDLLAEMGRETLPRIANPAVAPVVEDLARGFGSVWGTVGSGGESALLAGTIAALKYGVPIGPVQDVAVRAYNDAITANRPSWYGADTETFWGFYINAIALAEAWRNAKAAAQTMQAASPTSRFANYARSTTSTPIFTPLAALPIAPSPVPPPRVAPTPLSAQFAVTTATTPVPTSAPTRGGTLAIVAVLGVVAVASTIVIFRKKKPKSR